MACYIYIPILCACHMCELMQAMTVTTNYTQLLGNPFYKANRTTNDKVAPSFPTLFLVTSWIRFIVSDKRKGIASKPQKKSQIKTKHAARKKMESRSVG